MLYNLLLQDACVSPEFAAETPPGPRPNSTRTSLPDLAPQRAAEVAPERIPNLLRYLLWDLPGTCSRGEHAPELFKNLVRNLNLLRNLNWKLFRSAPKSLL